MEAPRGVDVNNYILINVLSEVNENELQWATRVINFTKAYDNICRACLEPAEIKRSMMASKELVRLEEIVPNFLINQIANEICTSFSLPTMRWLGYLLSKILSQTLSHIYINECKLLEARNIMGHNPVIFLPSHRSYADFILMSFICFHYKVQLPCVAAGIDFHSMRIMGEVLRRCKAFFMRRKFSYDYVYRSIFENYFKTLLHFGESPLEFFIEGTRSRTAKALEPKFGLLAVVIESYLNGALPDVTFVPISINYDRVLEEQLFACELLGIPKPKESTLGMYNGLKKLDDNYGNVYFHVGDPIHLRQWLQQNIKLDCPETCSVSHITNNFAHIVIQRQTELQILGVFNILAIVIACNISDSNGFVMTVSEAALEVQELCQLITKLGGSFYIADDVQEAIISSCELHSSLLEIVDNRVTLIRALKGNYARDGTLLNGIFCQRTIQHVLPLMILQQYVNPSLHLFVVPALLLFSLEPAKKLYNGCALEAFKYICEMFKMEFVTLQNICKENAYEEALTFLRKMKCIALDSTNIGANKKLKNFLCRLFLPFINGYKTVAQVLAKPPLNGLYWTERSIIEQCQLIVKRELENGLLHPYCLSKDLLKNALESFVSSRCSYKRYIGSEVYYSPMKEPLMDLINYLDNAGNINVIQQPPICRL